MEIRDICGREESYDPANIEKLKDASVLFFSLKDRKPLAPSPVAAV
jgi:hypothetical protein